MMKYFLIISQKLPYVNFQQRSLYKRVQLVDQQMEINIRRQKVGLSQSIQDEQYFSQSAWLKRLMQAAQFILFEEELLPEHLEIYGLSQRYCSQNAKDREDKLVRFQSILKKISFKFKESLTILKLYQNSITNDGMQDIFFEKTILCNFPYLVTLDLSKNKIGPRGIKYLISAKLTQIEYVNLNQNNFGNQGVLSLLKSDWPRLKTLSIRAVNMKGDGFISLFKNQWKQLRYLYISEPNNAHYICHLSACNWPNFYFNCLNELRLSYRKTPWKQTRIQLVEKFEKNKKMKKTG